VSDSGWDKYIEKRQLCIPGREHTNYGIVDNYKSLWYPTYPLIGDGVSMSGTCEQLINPNDVLPKVGGCKFEMSLGTCNLILDNNAEVRIGGCASTLETQMNASLGPASFAILASCVLQIFAVISSCFFCWKRKMQDTFPDSLKEIPWDPYKNADVDVATLLESQIHKPAHEMEGIEFVEYRDD